VIPLSINLSIFSAGIFILSVPVDRTLKKRVTDVPGSGEFPLEKERFRTLGYLVR